MENIISFIKKNHLVKKLYIENVKRLFIFITHGFVCITSNVLNKIIAEPLVY